MDHTRGENDTIQKVARLTIGTLLQLADTVPLCVPPAAACLAR